MNWRTWHLMRFSEPQTEAEFKSVFRTGGRMFVVWAYGTGAVLSMAAFVLIWLEAIGVTSTIFAQVARVLISAALGVGAFLCWANPRYTIQHYGFAVGGPLSVSVLLVSLMAYSNAINGEGTEGRLLVALVFATWLSYSFTRLHVGLILGVCGIASLIMMLALEYHESDVRFGNLLYLLLANVIGIVGRIQLERRERALFAQSLRLKALNAEVAKQIRLVQDSTAEKEQILEGVVHDLQQPVAALGLHFASLKTVASRPPGKDLLAALRKAEACFELIRSGVAGILKRRNAESLDLEKVDVATVLKSAVEIFEPSLELRRGKLSVAIRGGSDCVAQSNLAALTSILTNVIDNAVKYSKVESNVVPKVRIGVVRLGSRLRIDVCDNGIGVPVDVVDRVFDPHWRGAEARERGVEGAGIGLASVKRYCERLEGHSVAFRSRIGRGSRVSIYVKRYPNSWQDRQILLAKNPQT